MELRGKQKTCRIALLIGLILIPCSSFSKDLQGRLGLGYNSEFANSSQTGGTPAISLKYGLTRDLAASLIMGVRTSTPTNSVVAAKFFKNIFYESNLNFYFTTGLGMIKANNQSGIEILGGFGAEFFIPGIESLGFSVETGGSYYTLGGQSAFRTLGVSFLDAGNHFYF